MDCERWVYLKWRRDDFRERKPSILVMEIPNLGEGREGDNKKQATNWAKN